MLVNSAYVSSSYNNANTLIKHPLQMTVVPREEQFAGTDIGQRFFEIAMNSVAGASPDRAHRVFSGLKAVSALGNIIVVTFTAARGMPAVPLDAEFLVNTKPHSKTGDRQRRCPATFFVLR